MFTTSARKDREYSSNVVRIGLEGLFEEVPVTGTSNGMESTSVGRGSVAYVQIAMEME